MENSGDSCNYYKTDVKHPWDEEKLPYTAECGEVSEALGLTVFEDNIFKELWRRAEARKGKKKQGNTTIRGAEKINFFSKRILAKESRCEK